MSLPTMNEGGEPIGPTMTTQGSFDDLITRRELAARS